MKLIINADDFGLSKSISDGIVKGIKEGYLSSTSIMVNMKYAKYAVELAKQNGINCIGLHINLTVGKPLIKNERLTDENGVFLYNRKQIENPNLTFDDAYNEIMAQVNLYKKLSGGGIDHLDTHHHLIDNPNIKAAIKKISKELNLPVRRECDGLSQKKTDLLYHEFTIDNVNIETLRKFFQTYSKKDITVEIMTHVGLIDDYTKTVTSYLGRDKELALLKQAKEEGLFNENDLISFGDL